MSTAITVFSSDSAVVYNTKKGEVMSTSPEGALFKGGAALASLKDAALDSAMAKAANGRYGPATDILEAAFPKISAAVRTLHGMPSLNKFNFLCLMSGIENAPEGAKGFNKKQVLARAMVRSLRNVTALAKALDERVVLEMA